MSPGESHGAKCPLAPDRVDAGRSRPRGDTTVTYTDATPALAEYAQQTNPRPGGGQPVRQKGEQAVSCRLALDRQTASLGSGGQ